MLHVPWLEVVSKAGTDPSARPIVLFQGAWHTASCGGEGFKERLASQDGDVHTLSLRGHGAGDGPDRLRWHRIEDYIDEHRRVVDAIDGNPVLIGHSMGAYVARKHLEDTAVANNGIDLREREIPDPKSVATGFACQDASAGLARSWRCRRVMNAGGNLLGIT